MLHIASMLGRCFGIIQYHDLNMPLGDHMVEHFNMIHKWSAGEAAAWNCRISEELVSMCNIWCCLYWSLKSSHRVFTTLAD